MSAEQFYIYRWNRQDRKGQICTVEARGTMNSCTVRFADGYTMVTSRNALAKAPRTDAAIDKVIEYVVADDRPLAAGRAALAERSEG